MPKEPFSHVPEQLQAQFEQLGEELGVMMLKQFKTILSTEQQGIEKALEVLVNKQRQRILKQVEREFQQRILKQFDKHGSFFSTVSEQVLSNLISQLGDSASTYGTSITPTFSRSSGQEMLSLGRKIQQIFNKNA